MQTLPQPYLEAHFGQGLLEVDDPAYSHLGRWRTTARTKRFFSSEVATALAGYDLQSELRSALMGADISSDPVARAQHVEAAIFLPQYLLSSQGDRVSMAHAVEGRFPYLDHRLVEFCNRLPTALKLRGMEEKYLLKRAMADVLPASIRKRPKQPYRAPIAQSFLGHRPPEYVDELLSETSIRKAGYFNAAAVAGLAAKGRKIGRLSEMESMALTGILSVQLLHHQFIERSTVTDRAVTHGGANKRVDRHARLMEPAAVRSQRNQ
jgi:asparagine synthase (glutamine-hydrolysing)